MDKNQLAITTYNKIASLYTDRYFSDATDLPAIDEFLKLMPPNAKILDAGCGPGQHVKYLLGKNFEVIGIDLSEKMIEIARQKVPNGKFEVMDMRKTAFPDETFDGIISAYSLIHIQTTEIVATLKEFSRVLKPKGKVLLIVQKGDSDKIAPTPLKTNELMFTNFFDVESFSNLIRSAMYNILSIKETKTLPSTSQNNTVIYAIAQKI